MKCFLVSTSNVQYAIQTYKRDYNNTVPNFTAFVPLEWGNWNGIVSEIVKINDWHPSELCEHIIRLYQDQIDVCPEWRRKLVGIYEDWLTCKTKPFAIDPGPDYNAIDLTNGKEPKGILFC